MDMVEEGINEGINYIQQGFKTEKKKIKKKIKKVEKGKSPVGTAIVVLIIIVAGLFVAWYFPRLGQPIYGWNEDQALTQQYYDEYVEDAVGAEFVVLVDGAINSTCSYVSVYSRTAGMFWNPWTVTETGYYDFTGETFYFD
jgi:hypothetical protein